MESIEKTGFAVDRGYELSEKDIIRREVITEIMCNGQLDFEKMAESFKISKDKLKEVVDFSESKLDEFITDDLISFANDKLELKPEGFFVVRNIAMAFDPILKTSEAQYSKTV
jgi:oxygen-independent coproporphyrinogen-3 oxidase